MTLKESVTAAIREIPLLPSTKEWSRSGVLTVADQLTRQTVNGVAQFVRQLADESRKAGQTDYASAYSALAETLEQETVFDRRDF